MSGITDGDVYKPLSGSEILARLVGLGAAGVVFADNVLRITGSSDATKIAAFEVDGFTTATTRTFTLPDASTTLAGLSVAQTWTAAQTNSASLTLSATTGTTLIVSSTTASTNSTTGAFTCAGGGAFVGDLHLGGSDSGQSTSATTVAWTTTNTNAGAGTILAQFRAQNDASVFINNRVYGSGATNTLLGITMANWTAIVGTGASVAGMIIGPTGANAAPLVFGVGSNEVGRFSSGTIASGVFSIAYTLDASAVGTASITFAGGASVAKTLIVGKGLSAGVTSTATAAGTTTLTIASARTQVFTGTTTQTCQLPAANAAGAGVGIEYLIKNLSSGNVTVQRAGSDTINNASSVTSVVLAQWAVLRLVSDGVSAWEVV